LPEQEAKVGKGRKEVQKKNEAATCTLAGVGGKQALPWWEKKKKKNIDFTSAGRTSQLIH